MSLEYEERKKEHLASAKADPFSLMTTVESVCYMREHINQNEREEDKTNESEDVENEDESSDDGSTTNSDSIVVDGSEESEDGNEQSDDELTGSTDNIDENDVSTAHREDCVLLEDSSDEEHNYSESDVETEEAWSIESDGSVDERCCYISSAANIRRREMHGQRRYYQEEEPAPLGKRKRYVKKSHKKVDLAGLKDMQKKVRDLTSIDDRGLKKKNPKRANKCRKMGGLEHVARNC